MPTSPQPPDLTEEPNGDTCLSCPVRRALEADVAVLSAQGADGSKMTAETMHDLRTPLNGVMGFAQMIADPQGNFDLEDIQGMASNILAAGDQMLQTVNAGMDAAARAATAHVAPPTPIPVADAVRECGEMIRPIIAPGVEWRPPDNADEIKVSAAKSDLQNVLLNLLGNAAKFTDTGFIGVEVVEADGETRILVKDTGVGIQQSEIARILQPYEQGDQTDRSQQSGGSGLGLFIVARMVARMGGQFSLRSTPGVGTIAEVIVPTGEASDGA